MSPELNLDPKPETPEETAAKARAAAAYEERKDPDHPSHGLISFSRTQGRIRLFGSPIEPDSFITLRVAKASTTRSWGEAHHIDDGDFVEVYLSHTQFAEAITNMNVGCGIPCTIGYARDGKLQRFAEPEKQRTDASESRAHFKREVKQVMGSMNEKREEVLGILAKAGLSGKKQKEVDDVLRRVFKLFEDSAPFMMKQFEEHAEKVVATAKTEITAHADLVVRQTGLQQLAAAPASLPILTDGGDDAQA